MLHEALFVLNISYLCYMFYYIFVCILCFLVLQYPSIFILFILNFVIAFCFHYIINVYTKCAKLLKCKIVIIRKYLYFDNPNFFYHTNIFVIWFSHAIRFVNSGYPCVSERCRKFDGARAIQTGSVASRLGF